MPTFQLTFDVIRELFNWGLMSCKYRRTKVTFGNPLQNEEQLRKPCFTLPKTNFQKKKDNGLVQTRLRFICIFCMGLSVRATNLPMHGRYFP
jgi:hypothetical protein